MWRYQVSFHHGAATAHSERGKCKLPASPGQQKLNRTLATLSALTNLAALNKQFPFRCAPRRLVMQRYQVRFHHAAATAHSQREKCKLSASPTNQN